MLMLMRGRHVAPLAVSALVAKVMACSGVVHSPLARPVRVLRLLPAIEPGAVKC